MLPNDAIENIPLSGHGDRVTKLNQTAMRITTAFDHQGEIPAKYTCLGQNISVPCRVEEMPPGTRTSVLIFEDLDALPVPWTHWMVFNIPPSMAVMPEGAIPPGATEGLANNHSFGYEGPCPKFFQGVHRYRLVVFALDISLDLPAASEKRDVLEAMQGHVIDHAEVIGLCTSGKTGEGVSS